MAELRFTKDHEFISVEKGVGSVGVTDYAQRQLGDIVFVELPELGRRLKKNDQAAVVESVKAASEVFSPASGEVVAVNDALEASPGWVNEDPMGSGWFFKLRLSDEGELGTLMDEDAYRQFIATLD